ncbi:hypothetical protein FEM08_29780 [Flavobacterium gilvum]|nr:hypothetical protein FEM08_29780 [Flavobacterium gilvum]
MIPTRPWSSVTIAHFSFESPNVTNLSILVYLHGTNSSPFELMNPINPAAFFTGIQSNCSVNWVFFSCPNEFKLKKENTNKRNIFFMLYVYN